MLSLRKTLFQRVKKMIPRISDTEMIALQCGTTSIDRELFEGKVTKHNFQPMKQQMFDWLSSKSKNAVSFWLIPFFKS